MILPLYKSSKKFPTMQYRKQLQVCNRSGELVLLSSDCWPFTRSMGRTNSDDLIQSHYCYYSYQWTIFLLTHNYEFKVFLKVNSSIHNSYDISKVWYCGKKSTKKIELSDYLETNLLNFRFDKCFTENQKSVFGILSLKIKYFKLI